MNQARTIRFQDRDGPSGYEQLYAGMSFIPDTRKLPEVPLCTRGIGIWLNHDWRADGTCSRCNEKKSDKPLETPIETAGNSNDIQRAD